MKKPTKIAVIGVFDVKVFIQVNENILRQMELGCTPPKMSAPC
jgi:hypothetical protein